MAYRFVRARLRDSPTAEVHAAGALMNTYRSHQAAWDLLGGGPQATRDFVYRFDLTPSPVLHAVVPREPAPSAIWDVSTKAFEPDVRAGDAFQFELRANATTRRAGAGSKGARHDVVMDALRQARARGENPDRRAVTQTAGTAWLARQGSAHGFSLNEDTVRVDAHDVESFGKGRSDPMLRVASLDFSGILTVEDPIAFGKALREGIGPAKGFGMGLLLVRRA